MRRARSADQKEERRQSILAAARRLLAGPGFSTMEALSAEVGLAKGTLYLYFRTREEVLLAVLAEDLDAWLAEVTLRVPEINSDELADRLVEDLAGRPIMADLLARLGSTLEANVDEEITRSFKVRVIERMGPLGAALDRSWSPVPPGSGLRFCLWFFALLVGIRQLASPAPSAMRAIEGLPELASLRVVFADELRAALRVMIAGIRAPAG